MAVTVAIIGAGSMGSSLLKGMLSTDALSNENVRATTHSHASAQKLAQALGIRAIAAEDNANANAEAVQGADSVSYTHLTLPTNSVWCRSRWSPYH